MMSGYDWDFSFLTPYIGALARGVCVTIWIACASFVVGTVIGTLASAFLPRTKFGNAMLLINDAVRAVPILVLLFMVYYFPWKMAFGIKPLGPIVASIVAFTIAQAAYTVDLAVGALRGLPTRAWETGASLGLSSTEIWRKVLAPSVIRLMLPAQMAFFIGIIRLTSITSVIGAPDVVFVAQTTGNQSYRAIEAWLVVGLIYILLVTPVTVLARRLDQSDWVKRRW
ncbi:ABC transporter permease subunit [bacterium]|nr:ABC transporter permease subunit [bacterium]